MSGSLHRKAGCEISGPTRRGLVLQVLRFGGIWALLVIALPAPAAVGAQNILADGVYRVVEGSAGHYAWSELRDQCDETSYGATAGRSILEVEARSPWSTYAESATNGRPAYVRDSLDGDSTPSGTLAVVPGRRGRSGPGKLLTFRVEVEEGLDIDPVCFSLAVEGTLWDARSWGGTGEVAFSRVDGPSYDFRISLASPKTTDRLCRPLRTGGKLSCRRGDRVIINFWRWESGASAFGSDLAAYRHYLINHEVGHVLGRGHRSCPKSGRPAPIMMQQTKSVGSCTSNGWPLATELP